MPLKSYWRFEVERLAKFLRNNFPDEVEKSEINPNSSAVSLAIELLTKGKKGGDIHDNPIEKQGEDQE